MTAFTKPDVGDTVLTAGGLTWTGTEFGLVYLKQKAFNTHQVLLQRLNANGTSKAAAVVVGTAAANGASPVAVGWSACDSRWGSVLRAHGDPCLPMSGMIRFVPTQLPCRLRRARR